MDKKIENIIKKSQIEPSNQMISKLKQFYNLLIEGNKVCNLTAIVDEDGVIEKHFFDSIYPQKYFKSHLHLP